MSLNSSNILSNYNVYKKRDSIHFSKIFMKYLYEIFINLISAEPFNHQLSKAITFDDEGKSSQKSYSSIYLTSKYAAEQSSTLHEKNDANNYNPGD